MDFPRTDAFEILESTPRVLRAMLASLSDGWTMSNYGPGTFSRFTRLGTSSMASARAGFRGRG